MLEKFDGKDKRMLAGETNEPRYVQLVALHGGGASTGMLDGKNKRMLEKFHFKFLALALGRGFGDLLDLGPGRRRASQLARAAACASTRARLGRGADSGCFAI